jgi:hemerythrin HHE cation binding domain-containing protein
MAEMSMNKVIHGAFRRDLARFVDALTAFRPGDTERAQGLVRAWDNFDKQLVDHHEGEHEIAWPALQSIGVTPETIAQMDAEHTTMSIALVQAREAVHGLLQASDDGARQAALRAVERLREVTVTHLDHEEEVIEPAYLEHEKSPEIVAMGKKFAKVGPVRGGIFFAWLLDGIGPAEREALTSSVPGPVLAVLTRVFGRGYNKSVAPVWAA